MAGGEEEYKKMIKILDYNKLKKKLRFVVDMDTSLANAIRRSALEIPIMAIDEVEIIKNDSALYDEVLVHRIGLIPVKTSSAKEIKFKLKEIGPKTVYSGNIKPNIETENKIPIVILGSDQEIELIGNARVGKGIEHIKYSPGLIFYRHNLNNEILDFVNVDENGKINYDEEEIKIKLNEDQIKKIKSAKESNEILFEIESWGQIDVKEIFLKSIDALEDNLKELIKAVK